jgi:uncharacterized protein (DUF427 family)
MKMAIVRWNGVVLAESDDYQFVDGNYYFPPDSLSTQYLRPSPTHTRCPRKGLADHSHIEVNGIENPDAAWSYHNPNPVAQEIKDYVAFGNGVEITGVKP